MSPSMEKHCVVVRSGKHTIDFYTRSFEEKEGAVTWQYVRSETDEGLEAKALFDEKHYLSSVRKSDSERPFEPKTPYEVFSQAKERFLAIVRHSPILSSRSAFYFSRSVTGKTAPLYKLDPLTGALEEP